MKLFLNGGYIHDWHGYNTFILDQINSVFMTAQITQQSLSSRFFWMLVTVAIIAVAIWAFIAFRSSSNSAALQTNNASGQESSVYLQVEFSAAVIGQDKIDISGTASQSSRIAVYSDGALSGQTLLQELESNEKGQWSSRLDLETLADYQQVTALEFTATQPDGTIIRSKNNLFIIQPHNPGDDLQPLNIKSSHALILATEPGGASRVFSSPFGTMPSHNDLVLEAIDYDNSGGVIFSGYAPPNGVMRILANGAIIGETGIASNGRWELIAGSTLPIGSYKLTISWLGADESSPLSLEIPFERFGSMDRFSPLQGSGRMDYGIFSDDHWHLSRTLHGGGRQHTVIYSPLVLKL